MADDPQSNIIQFWSNELKIKMTAPKLTEDDAFLSNTPTGTLVYRVPAPHTLTGQPQESLWEFEALHMVLSIQAVKPDFVEMLACKSTSKCTLRYHRHYTPVLKYVVPPVVYREAEIELVFDPKSIMNRIKDVASDDLPFVQAKIGLANIDFEGYVRNTATYRGWYNNNVRGKVGDQKIADNHNVNMLWETGYAIHDPITMNTCDYTGKKCYVTKTIPAIFSIDQKQGYVTGGQVITVKGFGFGNGKIKPMVDGVECKIIDQTAEQFRCRAGQAAAPSKLTENVPVTPASTDGKKRRLEGEAPAPTASAPAEPTPSAPAPAAPTPAAPKVETKEVPIRFIG